MKAPSIRRKLLAALLITSTSVLFLTGIALVSYEFTSFKLITARNLSTLAQTIAANSSGALVFDDDNFAREILSGLRSEPDIVAACLFDKAGKLFATWSPRPLADPFPPRPGADGARFAQRQLILVQPVMQANARIGTLFVKQDLGGMYTRVTTYALVVFLVVAGSAAIAFLLASFFEKRIAQPILSLANTARQVSENKDFSLRATQTTTDELGRLTDAFNEMLSQIQGHQRQLMGELAARKKVEADLRESEERFRTLADNIVQLAWIADKLGWATWYNQRWYEYTGTTFQEMKDRGWECLHHPDHLDRVQQKLKASLERGQVWEDTFPLRGKDGHYRWFLSRAIPIRDEHGAVVRWFGTNTDVDDQKRAEQKLEQAVVERTAQLREANENLRTFSSTAAHDLRSPLRSIRSFSSAIMEDFGTTLDPEVKSYLARVIRSAEQMERLLNDLLEYSRISQAELRLESISLKEAAHDALSLLESDIRARNALVSVADPLPDVLGHRATVVLLIHNLLSNALKFIPNGAQPKIRIYAEQSAPRSAPPTPPNGNRTTRLEEAAARTDNISAPASPPPSTATSFVRLSVQDNGIGIATADIQKLFSAFQRLHGVAAYPGTGLGLAIVRKGAERMGGRVGVESEPGKGSRFWIELPIPNHEAPAQPVTIKTVSQTDS